MENLITLFEDEDVLVLDKPSGITVNKAESTKGQETVQGWIEKKYSSQFIVHSSQNESNRSTMNNEPTNHEPYDPIQEFYSRGGVVHRLDKETSGILLIAKNPQSFGKLKEQFIGRKVKKTYTALAHGRVIPDTGEINAPIGRLPFNRTHFGVIAGGREAQTLYLVRSIFNFQIAKYKQEILSLIELHPQTGRTHQIRVHLKYLGHPIFADELYAGRKIARDDRKFLPRLFLHASKIQFLHPKTGKSIEFTSPLPKDLQSFLSNLVKIQ